MVPIWRSRKGTLIQTVVASIAICVLGFFSLHEEIVGALQNLFPFHSLMNWRKLVIEQGKWRTMPTVQLDKILYLTLNMWCSCGGWWHEFNNDTDTHILALGCFQESRSPTPHRLFFYAAILLGVTCMFWLYVFPFVIASVCSFPFVLPFFQFFLFLFGF